VFLGIFFTPQKLFDEIARDLLLKTGDTLLAEYTCHKPEGHTQAVISVLGEDRLLPLADLEGSLVAAGVAAPTRPTAVALDGTVADTVEAPGTRVGRLAL
jgi:hypothetical protein